MGRDQDLRIARGIFGLGMLGRACRHILCRFEFLLGWWMLGYFGEGEDGGDWEDERCCEDGGEKVEAVVGSLHVYTVFEDEYGRGA
jgi:hypothetical protein